MADEGREDNGRFKKGNLFSLGGFNSGRPPVYTDPETMYNKIAEYMDWEDAQKGKDGKGIYTLEGCALYLGFATRQSMYDYEERSSEFSYIISKFKLFLTQWNVQKLYWGGTYMGSQFWLRNHGGYTDESTQHQIVSNVKADFGTTIPTSSEPKDNT